MKILDPSNICINANQYIKVLRDKKWTFREISELCGTRETLIARWKSSYRAKIANFLPIIREVGFIPYSEHELARMIVWEMERSSTKLFFTESELNRISLNKINLQTIALELSEYRNIKTIILPDGLNVNRRAPGADGSPARWLGQGVIKAKLGRYSMEGINNG